MEKNKENNTCENFKKRMEKNRKDGTGERNDVEDDKGHKKPRRSPNKNLSDSDSMNSCNSEFFLEKLSEDGNEGIGEMIYQLDLP